MEKSDETSLPDEKKEFLPRLPRNLLASDASLQFVKFTYISHLNALTDGDARM